MRIIITERQEQLILSNMLNEEVLMQDYRNKRLAIKKYLEDNFLRGSEAAIKDGYPSKNEYVIMKVGNKPTKVMTDKQLFYLLQDKFKHILPKEELNGFIKETMVAWYKKAINKNGNIVHGA